MSSTVHPLAVCESLLCGFDSIKSTKESSLMGSITQPDINDKLKISESAPLMRIDALSKKKNP